MVKNLLLTAGMIALLLSLNATQSQAFHNLIVRNPQQNWNTDQGTIEKATFSIRPKGLYMEVGMYLTFSARNTNLEWVEQLEVECHFELPEKAVVHDSWLWIGDTIIKGDIMDRWQASSIYEEIVDRQQDPSILFKNSKTQYELRIFPMKGTETRKVKITYLVPGNWNKTSVSIPLPMSLLQMSRNNLPELSILAWPDEHWQNPRLLELLQYDFELTNNSEELGEHYAAIVENPYQENQLHFAFDSPVNEGVFVSRFEGETDNIYQLALLPNQLFEVKNEEKIAILVDYDANNTNLSKNNIIDNIKKELLNNFASNDAKFNVFLSNLTTYKVSDTWLTASEANINSTFDALVDDDIIEDELSNYSNLPTLLLNGIQFIQENGNDGHILLVSNSQQLGDYPAANQLIDDLLELMGEVEIPIHVASYQNSNFANYYFNDTYYRGNEYFYLNISRLTGGEYFSNHNTNNVLAENFSNTLNALSGIGSSFDLHTSLDDGFCHSRYNINNTNLDNTSIFFNQPILQIGKYEGNFPFTVEFTGVYNGEILGHKVAVTADDVVPVDDISEKIWTNCYIEDLTYNYPQDNSIINTIIEESITKRVLSTYTAFLCLEPEQRGEICLDCIDEETTGPTSVEDIVVDSTLVITAAPNPFQQETTIKIEVTEQMPPSKISGAIYNALGQRVKQLDISLANNNQYTFTWNATNEAGQSLSKGMYLVVIQTPTKRHTLRLMYMK